MINITISGSAALPKSSRWICIATRWYRRRPSEYEWLRATWYHRDLQPEWRLVVA